MDKEDRQICGESARLKGIASEFNKKFEGKVISGSIVPRPKRSARQLRKLKRRN